MSRILFTQTSRGAIAPLAPLKRRLKNFFENWCSKWFDSYKTDQKMLDGFFSPFFRIIQCSFFLLMKTFGLDTFLLYKNILFHEEINRIHNKAVVKKALKKSWKFGLFWEWIGITLLSLIIFASRNEEDYRLERNYQWYMFCGEEKSLIGAPTFLPLGRCPFKQTMLWGSHMS